MDQLISRANFMHTDNDVAQNQFREELEGWMTENAEKMTLDDVLAALKATRDKICHPDFPSVNTSGYYMGFSTLTLLKQAISDCGKSKPEDIHAPFLDFVLQMIKYGPTSSHVEYILYLSNSDVEFREYLQSLRGEDLSKVIRALMKQYQSDPGMEWGRYQNYLERIMRTFINDVFSKEQCEEGHRDFIDVYMYFITAFNTREENIRKKMQIFADWIELKYDRNVFKKIKDVGLLKRYLADITKVVLAPEYPQGEDMGEATKRMVHHLLQTVSEDLLIGEIYEEIMDFALQLSLKKSGSQAAKDVFQTIGKFFNDLKKHCIEKNNKLYEGLVVKFTHLLDNIGDETFLAILFARPIVDNVLCAAMGTSREHGVLWIEMMKALLKHPTENCMQAAYEAMDKKKSSLSGRNIRDR